MYNYYEVQCFRTKFTGKIHRFAYRMIKHCRRYLTYSMINTNILQLDNRCVDVARCFYEGAPCVQMITQYGRFPTLLSSKCILPKILTTHNNMYIKLQD